MFVTRLKKILKREEDIHFIPRVETLTQLYFALAQGPVDILVLEARFVVGMTDMLPKLRLRWPSTRLLVLVTGIENTRTPELVLHGVQGVVDRSIAPGLLRKCVRKILDGEFWMDNASISKLIEAYRSQTLRLEDHRLLAKLSSKELSIVKYLSSGMRNKEIAYRTSTTEQVVKNRLGKIYAELGVLNRLELALYCSRHEGFFKGEEWSEVAPQGG